MEVRVLRYFLAIAKEESVSGAAKVLNITQPTLSKQLMELEEELQAQLFIRGNRRMILTDSGKLLRKRAQEIIELMDKSEEEIRHADHTISGSISIGSGETDAMRFVAKVALNLLEEHPSVQYHVYSGNAEDVMERLDNGLLDFGIVVGDVDIKKYDARLLPMTDVWGLLCPKNAEISTKAAVEKKDLEGLPLIWSKQALQGNELSQWFQKSYEDLHIVATYNLLYNAAILVEEGLGYALCLDKLVNTTNLSSLKFVPLEPKLEAPLHIIWKKSQVFSKAAMEFLKILESNL